MGANRARALGRYAGVRRQGRARHRSWRARPCVRGRRRCPPHRGRGGAQSEGRSVARGRELRTPERRDDLVSATQPLPRHPLPRGDPMTDHSIDTEALRVRAEHVYRHGGPANAIESLAANTPAILDRLAAAEHRATRAEAQAAIRGRAVAIYQQRAREAEAERDWNLRSSRSAKKGRIEANARADRAEARIKAVLA